MKKTRTERPNITRVLVLLSIAASGLLLLLSIDRSHRAQVGEEAALTLERELQNLENGLFIALQLRLAAVEDLRAFMLATPEIPEVSTFDRFAAGLLENYPAIRAAQYADSNKVIRYIYPLAGNEQALNLDLKTNPAIVYVEKAISERRTTVQPPFITAQGSLSIIARAPLYEDDNFLGLVQGVIDVSSVLADVQTSLDSSLFLQLHDDSGNQFYGTSSTGNLVRTADIPVGDTHWVLTLAQDLSGEPRHNPLTLVLIWGGGLLLLASLLHIVNQAWTRTQWLAQAVADKTIELAEANESLRHEIDQREVVNEALGRSRARFRRAIIDAPFPIMIHTEDGKVTQINNEWCRLTGYAREEITTISDWTSRAYGVEAASVKEDIERLFTVDERLDEGEYVVRTKEGALLTWHFISAPLGTEADGKKVAISIANDVTIRKQAEREREDLIGELESSNSEMERFTYAVSHDLKSPLITIRGFLGLLTEDLSNENIKSVHADIAQIDRAAEKMNDLLDELLNLSRVGRLVNPASEFSMVDLAGEAVALVAGRLRERGAEVLIQPDMPNAFGDRPRLLQLMQNLVDNAVKYMGDQPAPFIEIGARNVGTETVCFIQDNGVGIEPKFHERVFRMFNRVHANGEGVGMGLALAKRIVQVYGGEIWVESEGLGKGSTFYFTIPSAGKE